MTTSNHKKRGWVLGLAIFVMGGCGLAYEYTFSKIASDLLGNSVQQWAVVIAVMLFCMGMGAEAQRFIRKERVVGSLIASQIVLALLGGFGPMWMVHTFAHHPLYFLLVHYGTISAIGLLIGFEIPLITRINEEFSVDIRANLAQVLKMDYIGALLGALIWVFILPQFFTLNQTAFILALLTTASSLLCLVAFWKKVRHPVLMSCALALTVPAFVYGISQSQQWAADAEQSLYRDKVIFSTTTKYQHIVLTERSTGDVNCYINGHIQFSSADEHIYHEQLVHPAMQAAPSRQRVLILGGGDGLAAREVLKYPDVEEVVLVDLDPEITQLAAQHPKLVSLNQGSLTDARLTSLENLALLDTGTEEVRIEGKNSRYLDDNHYSKKVTILNLDAASYIQLAKGTFNVIIMDFPDPSSPDLAKLYSQHFYGHVVNKLTADGIVVQQSTSPFHAKEAYLCIGRTMHAAGLQALPYHDNVPSFGEWGWWIATRDDAPKGFDLAARLKQLGSLTVPTRYLSSALVNASLVFGKNSLHSEHSDITTLTHSAVQIHYLRGWRESL